MSGGEEALTLADRAWQTGDLNAVVAHLSAAIRAFTAADDPRRAALACVQLGNVYASFMGNMTAGRAWFTRASRLVADLEPCEEQGWVAIAALGCDVDDPRDLLARAELALDRARRFGNLNLEARALADGGLALVRLGDVDTGMAWLDEAMALVCGPADDVEAASKSVCSFFTACYTTSDFQRAGSWSGLLRDHGLMADARGGPIFLRSHCDSVQAALLVELGRWGEAEQLLERSIADFEAINQSPSWHPALGLAALRIRQGRYADAEQLLIGRDASVEGLLPAAHLHLARGELDLAFAMAMRGLAVLGEDRTRTADLRGVELDVRLARGDAAGASAAADAMEAALGDLDAPTSRARSRAARARVDLAAGDVDGGARALQEAISFAASGDMPWYRMTLLIDLAACQERAGRRADAAVAATEAAQLLAALDVVVAPAHAAVLERLAPTTRPTVDVTTAATLRRDGRWWEIRHGSTSARLPDSKGMHYIAALISRPGVEQHAFDLVDLVEGVAARGEGVDRRSLGHAGEASDSVARVAYRRQIEALRAEIDDCLAADRLEQAEARQDELDALVSQLAAAYGLGGRARNSASATERARLNVTRAIRAATSRLVEALPKAGSALDRHVRTGTYCCYEPTAGEREIRWIVQS